MEPELVEGGDSPFLDEDFVDDEDDEASAES